MREISYDPLWKKLVDVKWSKTKLAEEAEIGRGTITRMGKNEPVGLDAILKICRALDCPIYDVVSCDHETISAVSFADGRTDGVVDI